jgi:quercetin dioxygenase-like cupin family protein
MEYHVVDPDDLEPLPDRPSETRSISDAADLETLGVRLYRVEPGEDIPLTGLHYHEQQEELFYVLSGQLRVETPGTEFALDPGEVFVAHPESPHRVFNDADATADVHVLAVGAPSISDGHPYEE